MNEEKPTFKITDRRLFNPDGSPREDAQREDGSAQVEHRPSEAQSTTDAGSAQAAASTRGQETTTAANAPREDALNRTQDVEESAPDGGGDPTNFINLVMFIASPAAAALGLTEHPGLGAGEVDLELAKHCIDLLGALQQKTRGNLSLEERQTLDGLLAELRMQYLSLTGGVSAPAIGSVGGRRRGGGGSAGGGLTGNDITGGR